ncbi:sigma-70 family RNA polymerase sigma factor [Paenibacillus sp. FSL M7-1455]|jgi:RNA polymerase sigma-70 factor (ECF subfamily)|uniref:RNA polymerase sigma-H factor n=1 Tax=Paenibacillus cookii TaxID=157839 RepID=A0ABQ4LVC9_9BACL|nr:sigma-70 family RNA polymerase sigma factor [Paenibacillus cookii]GIO66706.1 RNA polymerase sigma-H factor [Paenibacillus cookii]HWO52798.1 sigma-70 family RNA polymerase sigma factor [Paenibacillus cookii]
MIDPSRDAALVKQVLAGHKDSFAQLVDTHKNKIYGLLLGMGASPQDAQDYTQEAFLKAYRKLASFREDSSFASWLYTIAVNVMRDAMRKKKDLLADDGVLGEGRHHAETPELAFLRKETGGEVQQLINQLPEKYRIVLLLRYTNELSYEEIAGIAGIKVNQVRNRLHRAKKSLCKMVKDKEGIKHEMLESVSDKRIHSVWK